MKTLASTFLLLFAVLAGYSQATLSEQDKDFLACATRSNLMDIRLGRLAATNASSQDVKMLGERMVVDHTLSNADLRALAEKKGYAVPLNLNDKQEKNLQELSSKTGKDFDKAYTKCMVDHHKEAIKEFKKEANKGEDPDFKNWASASISKLEQHKEMAAVTEKAVKKDK